MKRLNVTNLLLAEAQMLIGAVEFAGTKNYRKVRFGCDNDTVVSNFNGLGTHATHFMLEGLIGKYKESASKLENVYLQKISREENFMAHNSAKWAKLSAMEGEIKVQRMDLNILSDNREWFPKTMPHHTNRSNNTLDHNTANWDRLNHVQGECDLLVLPAEVLSDQEEWQPNLLRQSLNHPPD